MYIFDLFKRLLYKKNFGMALYLFLNTSFIVVFCASYSPNKYLGVFLGIFFYFISLSLALSPIGERYLRWQTGCKEIQDADVLNRIMPLFNEVYDKAKLKDPNLSREVKLYMNDDMAPNAFATGRRTVCLTRGLLKYSDEQIKAIFAHEFGHLSNKDTDFLLVILIGNFLTTIIFTIIKLFGMFIGMLVSAMDERSGVRFTNGVRILVEKIVSLWAKFGNILVLHSGRAHEYAADKYAYFLSYGEGLKESFRSFLEEDGEQAKGIFATLMSSHPPFSSRIAQLEQLDGQEEKEEEYLLTGVTDSKIYQLGKDKMSGLKTALSRKKEKEVVGLPEAECVEKITEDTSERQIQKELSYFVVGKKLENGNYEVVFPDFPELGAIIEKQEEMEEAAKPLLQQKLNSLSDFPIAKTKVEIMQNLKNGDFFYLLNVPVKITESEIVKSNDSETIDKKIENRILEEKIEDSAVTKEILKEEILKPEIQGEETSLSEEKKEINFSLGKLSEDNLGIIGLISSALYLSGSILPVFSIKAFFIAEKVYFFAGLLKKMGILEEIPNVRWTLFTLRTFGFLIVFSAIFSFVSHLKKHRFYSLSAAGIASVLFLVAFIVFQIKVSALGEFSSVLGFSWAWLFLLLGSVGQVLSTWPYLQLIKQKKGGE